MDWCLFGHIDGKTEIDFFSGVNWRGREKKTQEKENRK